MKGEKQTSNNRSLLIVILFAFTLIAGSLAGVYISFTLIGTRGTESSQVNIANVQGVVTSKTDGKQHNFTGDFSIVVSKKRVPQEEQEKMRSKILDSLNTLDYDELRTKNGMEYLKQNVQENIQTMYSDTSVENVYISNLLVDLSPSYNSKSTSGKKGKAIKFFK